MKNIFVYMDGKTMTRIVDEYATLLGYNIVENIDECDIIIFGSNLFMKVRDQYESIISKKKWLCLVEGSFIERAQEIMLYFQKYGEKIFNYIEVPFYKEELQKKLDTLE